MISDSGIVILMCIHSYAVASEISLLIYLTRQSGGFLFSVTYQEWHSALQNQCGASLNAPVPCAGTLKKLAMRVFRLIA